MRSLFSSGLACLIIMTGLSGASAEDSVVSSSDKAAEERDSQIHDLVRLLSHWLRELSSAEEQKRSRAAKILKLAAGIVWDADVKSRLAASDHIVPQAAPVWTDPFPDDLRAQLANCYRKEFRGSLDAMIQQFEQITTESEISDPAVDALAICIAVSSPDGAGIIKARRALPPSIHADRLLWMLFVCTSQTMPETKPLHSVLVPELRKLSPQTHDLLEELWNEAVQDGSTPKSLAHLGIGFLPVVTLSGISSRERTQEELPIFIEALKPKYPNFIRCVSLASLCELRWEAEPALPAIKEILDDESPLIRQFAATVIINIELEESRIPVLADRIMLKGDDRKQFVERCTGLVKSEMQILSDDISFWKDQLESAIAARSSPSKRYVLRHIQHLGPAAIEVESKVRQCLVDDDALAREFAKRALRAIRAADLDSKH
ncbi:hypothetical protein [Fuerstiella marisgermanici]|uniref:HEAT repeat protein n=1 Tax=Fuerstiella marisgermanici TaxID=1891926 RepID=A0A1P8WMA3_9PLAN|nr:hypothetical protein [Fuerstiella marisgermanici]APZ95174.1 hypothetical protein Fuma_04829 [Fuerstiella marisgermanici]